MSKRIVLALVEVVVATIAFATGNLFVAGLAVFIIAISLSSYVKDRRKQARDTDTNTSLFEAATDYASRCVVNSLDESVALPDYPSKAVLYLAVKILKDWECEVQVGKDSLEILNCPPWLGLLIEAQEIGYIKREEKEIKNRR